MKKSIIVWCATLLITFTNIYSTSQNTQKAIDLAQSQKQKFENIKLGEFEDVMVTPFDIYQMRAETAGFYKYMLEALKELQEYKEKLENQASTSKKPLKLRKLAQKKFAIKKIEAE